MAKISERPRQRTVEYDYVVTTEEGEYTVTIVFVDHKFDYCKYDFGARSYTKDEWEALALINEKIEELIVTHNKIKDHAI